jgi:hypothetical protein
MAGAYAGSLQPTREARFEGETFGRGPGTREHQRPVDQRARELRRQGRVVRWRTTWFHVNHIDPRPQLTTT